MGQRSFLHTSSTLRPVTNPCCVPRAAYHAGDEVFLASHASSGRSLQIRLAWAQEVIDVTDDPDGDSLPTFFELGGNPGAALHRYGASPFARDIFVQLDRYKGTTFTPPTKAERFHFAFAWMAVTLTRPQIVGRADDGQAKY